MEEKLRNILIISVIALALLLVYVDSNKDDFIESFSFMSAAPFIDRANLISEDVQSITLVEEPNSARKGIFSDKPSSGEWRWIRAYASSGEVMYGCVPPEFIFRDPYTGETIGMEIIKTYNELSDCHREGGIYVENNYDYDGAWYVDPARDFCMYYAYPSQLNKPVDRFFDSYDDCDDHRLNPKKTMDSNIIIIAVLGLGLFAFFKTAHNKQRKKGVD